MRWLVVISLCVGCDQLFGVGSVVAQDGGPEVRGSDATACIGSTNGFVQYCPSEPLGVVTLTDPTIDTGRDPRCRPPKTGDACVIAGSIITVPGVVVVSGPVPLVLAAETNISIAGTLDASSRTNANPNRGPAANDASCTTASSGNQTASASASGGPGGSFGGDGGAAGDGGDLVRHLASTPISTLAAVRGGCPGSFGGGLGSTNGGAGGDSGGAVDLVANGSITITGGVFAGGAGGYGGPGDTAGAVCSGGGGGGSGGTIILEAPMVTVTGALIAPGGGGGGGALGIASGMSGNDPDLTQPSLAAAGGSGAAGGGGIGGMGSFRGRHFGGDGGGGNTCGTGGGGGGGGGGDGVLAVRGTMQSLSMATIAATPL